MSMVAVRLGGRIYALHIEHVTEVLRMVAVTPLPDAPEPVHGVINLRGRPVAVVGLAERLGVAPPPYHPDTFMLVLSHNDRWMAVPVDEVVGVVEVAEAEVLPSPVGGTSAAFVGGVITKDGDQILVLDPVVLFDAGLADYADGERHELGAPDATASASVWRPA